MSILDDRVRAALGEIMDEAPVPGASPNPVYFSRIADRRPKRTSAMVTLVAAAVSAGLVATLVTRRDASVEIQAPANVVNTAPADAVLNVPTTSAVSAPDTQPATTHTTSVGAAPATSTGWYSRTTRRMGTPS